MDERLAVLMARGAAAAAAAGGDEGRRSAPAAAPRDDGGDPSAYVRRMREVLDRERSPPSGGAQDGAASSPPLPAHAARLLEAARARLAARRWADARAHADAARSALQQQQQQQQQQGAAAPPPPSAAVARALRTAAQVGAVAAVHEASDRGDWRGLLMRHGGGVGIGGNQSTDDAAAAAAAAAAARAAYCRLAALVHPDKCGGEGIDHAGEAFAALSAGFSELVEADAAEAAAGGPGGAAAAGADAAAAADDDAAWWAEWDRPAPPPQGQPPPAFSDADLARWRDMPLADLEEETRALQAAVLVPPPGAPHLPLPQREARLRAARSALSGRLLSEAQRRGSGAAGGGDAAFWASGWGAEGGEEEGLRACGEAGGGFLR